MKNMKNKHHLNQGIDQEIGERKSAEHPISQDESDSESPNKDRSDSNPLIQPLGRDITINCLLRLPRSDYGVVASLNRCFRSLVRSGDLYKLRRLAGISEQWVYISCSPLEWEGFDPDRRRWMQLPRMPPNDCFMLSDKVSMAIGTDVLVFGKSVMSHTIMRGWSNCGFICSVKFPNPREHYDALILRDHLIWTLKTSNDVKVLNVGEELRQEQLPFRMGYRLYQLHGLKASMWYEVKISYPASIPASFSIQLKRDKSDLQFNMKRRLLNTEKLIFKADSNNMGEVHVLVIVEPAGVVAKPHVHESQFVIFNIVCDELSFGIPHKAWWVGMLAFLCLGVALVIPNFLPSFLLFRRIQSHDGPGISKGS